jgi:hypothetical protein
MRVNHAPCFAPLLALLALVAFTVISIEPAVALDRLLMLGGIQLVNWLDGTCTQVKEMKDVDELEARRKRIVNLQNEARAEVDRTADTWTQASENYVNALPDMRATAKAIEEKAEEFLLQAKKSEAALNEKVPALMTCIRVRKAEIEGGETPSTPVTPIECRVEKPKTMALLRIVTRVNTPCEINFATLLAVALTGTTNSELNSQITAGITDVRLEQQPSRGSAFWRDPVLTYSPAEDYKGDDRFTMSQAGRDIVDGQLVLTGRRETIAIDVDVEAPPEQ